MLPYSPLALMFIVVLLHTAARPRMGCARKPVVSQGDGFAARADKRHARRLEQALQLAWDAPDVWRSGEHDVGGLPQAVHKCLQPKFETK